ncbi:4-carboxymuconolactone decarboxylase [Cohaesibacter sp. ES.047]|uniref:carboxymuconolactone decarboxylase family protein n=1 Tax=Cohaesibacter sp. ES.047 TaxID=1798205 RepID=UPI000BB7D462|nr:carboxymuconolactone decarboxylase family protein [Cohaesibacter sp. ES.047]SNY91862.1 4-carboxymuconolactone decarboxylase [Cohaesibacter sp. ES.047]
MTEAQSKSPVSNPQASALERGRAYCAKYHPHLEAALSERYDAKVPDFSESLIEWAYGRHYSRPGLDAKTRQLATIAALTALGGQTEPQLRINIEHSLAAGCSEQEILEIIWQMSVYGGLPAAINGLNVALEFFSQTQEEGMAPEE